MELRYFLSVLSKRKWLLLLVILATAITTWFVVNKLPKKYLCSAALETGILSYQTIQVDKQNPFVQEYEIEAKFSNLTEYMKSRPALKALTKKLMLHDLKPENNSTPFRNFKSDKLNITPEQIQNYLSALEMHPDSAGISDSDLQNLATARALEKELGYDYETLFGRIDIKRMGKTEYVKIEYTSEDPKLSYFVIKNFVDEFMNFYYSRKKIIPTTSSEFYNDLVATKKRTYDSLVNLKANYSKVNMLVNPEEENKQIVDQIKELESKRNEEEKKYEGAKKTVDVYAVKSSHIAAFNTNDYSDNTAANRQKMELMNEKSSLRVQEVETKDPAQKKKIMDKIEDIDSKLKALSYKTAVSKRDENDPVIQRQNEYTFKYTEAESDMKASGAALAALNSRIRELYGRKNKIVGNNADLDKLDSQIGVAEEEYKFAVNGQNLANVNKQSSNAEQPMKIIEEPVPPIKPISSKAPLLAAFAGVGMGTVAIMLLFLISYFDRTLSSPFQFTKLVNLPMLGVVNNLNARKIINFDNLYVEESGHNKEHDFFKESLRRVRHEIESSGSKTFLFVSLKEQEGKSFMAAALAHSLSMKNQRVLLIDTNFKNNTLSGLNMQEFNALNPAYDNSVQAFQNKGTRLSIDFNIPSVAIIGNKGGNNSPSELLSGVNFRKKVYDLSKNYDYVFLEAACLNKFSDARELVDCAEKVIPIFDARTKIAQIDEDGIHFLKSLENRVLGCVLNKADLKALA